MAVSNADYTTRKRRVPCCEQRSSLLYVFLVRVVVAVVVAQLFINTWSPATLEFSFTSRDLIVTLFRHQRHQRHDR